MYEDLIAACRENVLACRTVRDIDATKSRYLGKKSALHQQFVALRHVDVAERKHLGMVLNAARDAIEALLTAAYARIKQQLLDADIAATACDVTLPLRQHRLGSRHPISLARERLVEILRGLHFVVCDGPEIEDDMHNFTLLNVGPAHPARAEQDTFYIKGHPYLLRTHTSPVQIRVLQQQSVPVRIMAPGRVYRADMDATHTPMFHQIEGMVIDQNVHMGHLKGMIIHILRAFFDRPDLHIRFRPGYFPFTEPSAEVDIWWQGRWLEVLGSGMVHPAILRNLAIDPMYTGYAFGLGVDRLAMLRYGMDDLRMMFENDHRMSACFTGVDV